jgi:Flp pilus assembly protein TadG
MTMLPRRDKAISTVSFALIAPVFLLIVFGTMEVGRIFNNWMIITNEAREAARYGAVTFDATQSPATEQATERAAVTAYLAQRLNGVLDPRYLTPAPDVTVTSDARPKIQVTIYYQVPLVIPIVSRVLPNPFPIAARSAMQGE